MNHSIVILVNNKNQSGVANRLSQHFDCNQVTAGYYPAIRIRDNTCIFNYGVSRKPIWHDNVMERGCFFVNNILNVRKAINKKIFFDIIKNTHVPSLRSTTSLIWAKEEWHDKGDTVYLRHKVRGSKGEGIEVVTPENNFPLSPTIDCPLFTKGVNISTEYRIHVFGGKVIASQVKIPGVLGSVTNYLVRTVNNGWTFLDAGYTPPLPAQNAALQAMGAIFLDYGGVDIIETYEGEYLVCEVNSAPGMTPETFTRYVNHIEENITHA